MVPSGNIEIFQEPGGATEIEVTFDQETVWLNQEQLGQLFDRDRTVIGRHIRNIFHEGELEEKVVCAKFAHTTQHGAIKGKVQSSAARFYNLDVVISVGYRVKSLKGTQFRQWANQRLKEYLIQGYSVNRKRLEQTSQELHVLKSGIRILSRAIEEKSQEEDEGWLGQFAKGLELLDDYDHESLDTAGHSETATVYPSKEDYQLLITQMKEDFDSDVFAVEKDKGFDSAINQISKGFEGRDFYPSLEEKAATLLYLVTKNHAFADGNKNCSSLFPAIS